MTTHKYGPQTPEIEALIAKIETISLDQARALDAAWDALDAAWDAWDALAAAWNAAWDAAWNDAWNAALDAVLALMVRDLISGDQFDVLYGPWASVMEGGEKMTTIPGTIEREYPMTPTCLLCNCEITSPYYELVRVFDHKQPVCKTCLETVREGLQ